MLGWTVGTGQTTEVSQIYLSSQSCVGFQAQNIEIFSRTVSDSFLFIYMIVMMMFIINDVRQRKMLRYLQIATYW